jgi:hypothetical protein
MNPRKRLVLDANILMRAVLGLRVRELLESYEDTVPFWQWCGHMDHRPSGVIPAVALRAR